MKQSISGFLLSKRTWNEEGIAIKIPIMVYLNMIDAQEVRDKLNLSRSDKELINPIKYELEKICVVPG